MKEHILVVEDDESIQIVVRNYLQAAGYHVTCADDGLIGLTLALEKKPDLVVLDVNLPSMRGFEVAEQLRLESDVYIIMLTARGEEEDRIRGLKIGADDYIAKPFSPRELIARVEAVLRRQRKRAVQQTRLNFPNVTIDVSSHEVWTTSGQLELTTTEFNVLLEFARHAGQVLTRQQLLNQVWGTSYAGNDRVVDVYVGQVRRKLEDATGQTIITTVRGVGYKFKDTA
jgi:two-component system alkaline phosphatase synthesis response regulator PhoP